MTPIKKKIIKLYKKSIKSINTKNAAILLQKDMKHKYNKYYPSILDPKFSHKIATHKLFKKYKLTINNNKLQTLYKEFDENKAIDDNSNKQLSNVFILKPTQKLLRNFMSPYTPYRSLLIYHEMGVGKTCTAITIAEILKSIVVNSNTKIYVIRPDEFEREIFNINVIREGNPVKQCTGNTYINNPIYDEYLTNCSTGNAQSCDQLKSKVDKDIRKIYEFTGAQTWANTINKEITLKTKGIEDKNEKDTKIKQIIGKRFNNSVLIIDEAHDLREGNEKESKIVPPILNMVLEHSTNLRLIFLTATPIYDKPQNIISMINYFLINDKRPKIKESEVFNINGDLKTEGRTILENNTRGYISYLRGNNPYEFPIRISAKYNIPNQILDLNNYPSKNIYGKTIDKKDKIKLLELVSSPLKGAQEDIINYHIKYYALPLIDENHIDDLSYDEYKVSDNEYYENIKTSKKSSKDSKDSKPSSHKDKDIKDIKDNEIDDTNIDIPRQVAYQFVRQISNFVYQSLAECNNNIILASGDIGLAQVTNKIQGKMSYEFKDPSYGKRFKLPELHKWGTKIASVLERALASNNHPIFVYTGFISSGIIPLAFALEMNGFKRYKQHGSPLLENQYKDTTFKGDYIIYTGNKSLSQYAKEYLDKGRGMINEKTVKIFIGTSKASEGLNLFGYRETHILDPWHNINLIEQSIGRVIRTGSHLHLPPQQRNVSVYLYAATLPNVESYDLKIYKICEDKAIKSGIVEKILKENAFDCELNKDVNFYDTERYGRSIPLITSNNKHIKITLSDVEYSRSCFYMKDCKFNCSGEVDDKKDKNKDERNDKNKDNSSNDNDHSIIPIMKFNYDKDIEEFINLIKELMKSSFNIKINNLKRYLMNTSSSIESSSIASSNVDKIIKKILTKKIVLKGIKGIKGIKTKITEEKKNNKNNIDEFTNWEDLDAFNSAIQEIINTDIIITDKFGRNGKIILSGEYLRFIPEGNLEPNMSIQKQIMKPVPKIISKIDLKEYITIMNNEQTKLKEGETLNYDSIIAHSVIEKTEQIFFGIYLKEYTYNIKTKIEEIYDIVFSKLIVLYKIIILKTLLVKILNGDKLKDNEKRIESAMKHHIVYMKDIFPNQKQSSIPKENIYGFIIQNEAILELYSVKDNNIFEKNLGNLKKVKEQRKSIMDKTPNSKLYGFLKYEKQNTEPIFKITDIIAKGEKKSVRGLTCSSKTTSEIKKNLNKLDDKVLKSEIKHQSKVAFCNDVEIILRRNDVTKKDGKKWFYTPEEYSIYFGDS